MIREYPLGGATADPDQQAQQLSEVVVLLPRTALRESPHNPRRHFNPSTLDELADSILSSGMLQPIVVRPIGGLDLGEPVTHEIVFGHRRFRAAGMAGQAEVPCIVREMSDRDARIAQHAENLHRQDVHYLEEGDSLADLIASGISADRIAADLGKSRSYVYGRAKLSKLSAAARAAAMEQALPAEIALMIARFPAEVQSAALRAINDGGAWASARESKRRLSKLATPLGRATWKLHDAHLLDHTNEPAPSCNTCPSNSLNDRSLTDLSEPSCMDRPCWERKQRAQYERDAALARESGILIAEPGGAPAETASAASTPSTAARARTGEAPESSSPHRSAAPSAVESGFAGWTPEEVAMASAAGWERAKRAILARLLGSPRTIEDLRLIVLDQAMNLCGFGVAGQVLGAPDDLATGDMPGYIATLSDDQLSALSVMLAIESMEGPCTLSAAWDHYHGTERVRLARAYGVDPLAMGADTNQPDEPAAPAATPSKPAPKVRYRCPMTGAIWSGRGQTPKWLRAALEQGRTLADMEITE